MAALEVAPQTAFPEQVSQGAELGLVVPETTENIEQELLLDSQCCRQSHLVQFDLEVDGFLRIRTGNHGVLGLICSIQSPIHISKGEMELAHPLGVE